MSRVEGANAETLAKIMLIQSMVREIPETEQMLRFICRGLVHLPGVERAWFDDGGDELADDSAVAVHRFLLDDRNHHYGALWIESADDETFDSYAAYIHNLVFFAVAVLGDRDRLKLTEGHQQELEDRVTARTRQLSEQVRIRVAAEKQTELEKQRAERYLEVSEAIILELDTKGGIGLINQRGCNVLGYSPEDLTGNNWFEVAIPFERSAQFRQAFTDAIASGVNIAEYNENDVVNSSGDIRRIAWHNTLRRDERGRVLGTLSSGSDITALRRAENDRLEIERQLQHAQKLESLGVLAGGIAHDFNNLLVGVLGNVELALLDLSQESPTRPLLHRIEEAAAEAARLARQMLDYSGKGRFDVALVDLNLIIRECGRLARSMISKKAYLRFELANALPAIEADSTQLQQVFLNLLMNASEALGDEAGTITIRTEEMTLDHEIPTLVAPDRSLAAGDYVCIRITDTGCGMNETTLARIFDPFFSTKFTGRGLGLAAVHGILRGHGGNIRAESEPGKGARFEVLLPRVDGSPATMEPVTEEKPSSATWKGAWKGTGTILVVDDEPVVLSLARSSPG